MLRRGYRRIVSIAVLFSFLVVQLFVGVPKAMADPAGLSWGPVYIGNLKIQITNTHYGYAGPKVGKTNHFNVQVFAQQLRGYVEVANYHVSVDDKTGKFCVYIWDSVSDRTIFDACSNDYMKMAQESAKAIRSAVETLLANGNWVVKTATLALLVAAIIDLILPIDPIPVLPTSVPGPVEIQSLDVNAVTS